MLVDQELFDETLKIRSSGGTQATSLSEERLVSSPSWDNEDTKVPTAGAADHALTNVVGNG